MLLSLVATLVITIAFAAAITVPGDSDSRGMPNYLHEPSFTIFGISNALALFSSVCFGVDVPGHPHFTFLRRRFSRVPAQKINHWPHHLVLFNCKLDGCICCDSLHSSVSSMEMGHYSNGSAWLSTCLLICNPTVSTIG
ncbi:hypothetical protein WN943_022830 [Citrus x changshan-huyou]